MTLFKRIVILYGTETGNSADLSKIIAWSLSRLDSEIEKIQVMACDDYPIQDLPNEKFILIICSTSGLGDVPLNMKKFWRFLLRKDLPLDSLKNLIFGVIGFGDSSYAKYNFVAKKLFKRLLSLSAKNILELCLGDEQHEFGSFYTIDPWLKKFFSLISPLNATKFNEDDSLITPSFQVKFVQNTNNDNNISNDNLENKNSEYNELHPFKARVLENKRLTSEDHFQDVRLIQLQLDTTIQYELTDVCVVYPENNPEDVKAFLNLFNEGSSRLDAKQLVQVELNQKQYWIPESSYYFHLLKYNNPCSIGEIFSKYMDINSIPKRSFFELFFRFSRDSLEKNKLKRFASGIDLDELIDYVNRPKRTILEVMADFPNTTPYVPFQYLFDLIPAISWRSYSIASTPLESPNTISILYAVVNYRTRLKKPRLGQCTNWMVKQQPHTSCLSIFLRPSTFKFPADEFPIIMIAAGTGVAPFRAFIRDRICRSVANNYLFFGCRYSEKDFYLKDEWKPLIEEKFLTVFTAFSREDPKRKVYVQHIVWQQRTLIQKLFFEQNGSILIAGKSKQYPELIRETLINIFKEKLQQEDKYLENMFDKFISQKRIQFECW